MTSRKRIEKLTVNNQIVSMRKDVKRARLWLINNLNHKAKKLRNKKSDQQKEKNIRKVDRCLSEVQVLKHIEIDEVSKFALCSQFDEKKLQSEMENLETEQRAMLRLASHKFIQNQVTKFRETHSVPMDRFVLLVRSLGLQYQKKKMKKRINLENPSQDSGNDLPKKKNPTKKVSSSLPRCGDSIANLNDDDGKAKKLSASQDELKLEDSLIVNPICNELSNPSPILNNGDGKTPRRNEMKSGNRDSSFDFQDKLRGKMTWPESKIVIDKKIGTMEIKQLHLDKMPSENIAFSSQPKSSHQSSIFEQLKDSFFLGGVDPPPDVEDETSLPIRQVNKSSKAKKNHLYSHKGARDFTRQAEGVEDRRKLFNEKRPDMLTDHSLLRSVRQLRAPNDITLRPLKDRGDTNLHPSWQAKRKQKELVINVAECQGKKIKFDD